MRPPSNSHGDWPFLRPPERVPEVPVVSREHLPQLEKMQEVLNSRRDEAHFRPGVSRLITPNLWNFQRFLHTLSPTQEVPPHPRLHSRGSTRVPPTYRGAPIPPLSSRGGILSLRLGKNSRSSRRISRGGALHRKVERNSRVGPPFQESPSCLNPFPALPRLSSRGSTHTTVASGTALWESLVGKPPGKGSRETTEPLIHSN